MRMPMFTAVVLTAFVAGGLAARSLPSAMAATDGPVPRIVNVLHVTDEELGPYRPGTEMRSETVYNSEKMSVSIQTGNVVKHLHNNTDEIQYIVEGSGTFWLDGVRKDIGPGDLIVIPKGTAHAGSLASTGRFKAVVIKSPPQAPDDVHLVD